MRPVSFCYQQQIPSLLWGDKKSGQVILLLLLFAWDGGGCRAGTQDVLGNLWRSLLSCSRATAWRPCSGLRIPGMPSACVTVIITSHYLTVEGGGVRCHRRVAEGLLIHGSRPASEHDTCWKQVIPMRWSASPLLESVRPVVFFNRCWYCL